jgi:protein-S-isoprenylcysteine O-methyltransferase Ste14
MHQRTIRLTCVANAPCHLPDAADEDSPLLSRNAPPALPPPRASAFVRFSGLAYALIAYLAFNSVLIYCIGFVGNFMVPLSIDAGRSADTVSAMLINVLLLALFGVQHSVMARPGFKGWITRIVPKPAERSTYVMISSVLLAVVMWQWRPIPTVLWHVEANWAQLVIWVLFAGGWLMALAATFLTDHFEMLGVKQALAHFRGQPCDTAQFHERALYRWVRHPIMLGQIIAFWAIPTMTAGHLLFATIMLAYTLIGLHFEERDLVKAHGDAFRDYQKRIPKLVPRLKQAKRPSGN